MIQMLGIKIQLIWLMNFKNMALSMNIIIKGDEGHGFQKRNSRLELWQDTKSS